MIDGVLISADSVDREGDEGYGEFVVRLEEGNIDIRLNDRKGTIWMVEQAKVESALKALKQAEKERDAAWQAKQQKS